MAKLRRHCRKHHPHRGDGKLGARSEKDSTPSGQVKATAAASASPSVAVSASAEPRWVTGKIKRTCPLCGISAHKFRRHILRHHLMPKGEGERSEKDSTLSGRSAVELALFSLVSTSSLSGDSSQQAFLTNKICPDCGWIASNLSSYKRHRLRHHLASMSGKGRERSEKASAPSRRVGSSTATVAVSAAEAKPVSSIPVLTAVAPMKPAVSGTCRNCGRRGHYARDCQKPARMGSGNSSLTCRNCMQDGHLAKNCPLPRQQLDIARQAEDGARKLEELYARVVETQRNLTFMQQQAQMGIPPSRPGSMMGNMPGNMPGNLPGNMPGNMPVNMGGNMPGPSYGMGGAFSGIPQGRPYGMGTQMGMNMGMQYGSVPQQSPGDWQGQGQDKQYPQQLQQHENVYIRRQ